MSAIDPELKKKIVNTISRYEQKCDKLQIEIDSLKSAVFQLTHLPGGIYIEVDKHLDQLRTDLEANTALSLEQRITMIAGLMAKFQKKRIDAQNQINPLLRQSTEVLGRLFYERNDKRQLEKMKQLLQKEYDAKILFEQFNQLIEKSVSLISKKIEVIEAPEEKHNLADSIGIEVNESLNQLANHLLIPSELNEKMGAVKIGLERKLTSTSLSKIINDMTELVIEAFNLEQGRFKVFLKQLSSQLNDFNKYLQVTTENNRTSIQESSELETNIQGDLDHIRNHIENAKTVEELAENIKEHLELIGSRIRGYRSKELNRVELYEKHIQELQSQLMHSEDDVEEINNLLSLQKYRINHDSLTGIANREAYNEHIVESFNRWKRNNTELSLAVADIDKFKTINDTYGHLAGDKVLKKIASIFKSSLRSMDFVARYGGEEFVIILENTNHKDAKKLMDKLRVAVEKWEFCYKDDPVAVTVSFGLTAILPEDDIESFFARADGALYKAKSLGRNRVEVNFGK